MNKVLIIERSFGDSVIANAMLVWILHHAKVFQIVGPSYHMKGNEGLFKEVEPILLKVIFPKLVKKYIVFAIILEI